MIRNTAAFSQITGVMLALSLTGCATAGTAITPAQVAFIKDGVTPQEDVRRQLGAPHVVQQLQHGEQLVIYDFTKADSHWITLMPYIGPMLGSAKIQHQTLALLVNSEGIIETHLLTASQTPLRMGLLLRMFSARRRHPPATPASP